VLGYASLGLSLVAVGGYAFRSAHTLWGRFDFESTLTWIEMEGSFIRSKIDLGNRLQDRVFTERDVINVENMTLRVWITQLRSVVFGHQSHGSVTPRIITGMLGRPEEAEYLKHLITQFAGAQSIVVAPGTAEDARRMAMMGAMNALGAANSGQTALPPGFVADALLAAVQFGDKQSEAQFENVGAAVQLVRETGQANEKHSKFCPACGAENESDAAFCDSCGQPMNKISA
jgi:membrane protease subunit (stomatin/prohibitin family)